jgi:hypothetical protein
MGRRPASTGRFFQRRRRTVNRLLLLLLLVVAIGLLAIAAQRLLLAGWRLHHAQRLLISKAGTNKKNSIFNLIS